MIRTDGVDRTSMKPALERAILAAILLCALTLRVVYVLQMRASPFFDDPQVDQLFYVEWGRALAHGESHMTGPFPVAPLYAWWLALVFKLCGESLLVARLLQAGLGTIAVALLHFTAKRVFGVRAGLVAAALAATYWVLLYFDGELVRDALANPINMFGLWLALVCSERPSARRSAFAGVVWGVSALLRPQVLLFVPLLAVWFVWISRAEIKVALSQALVFLAAVATPIAPVTAYNVFVGQDRVLISPEAGQTLWTGNNPAADGVSGVAPGTRGDFWGHNLDAHSRAEQEEGRALRPSEVSSHYVRKTLAFVRDDPWAEAKLLLRKLWLFCTDWEFGNPEEPRFFAERFAPIVRVLPLSFGSIAALAGIGLFLRRRRARDDFPLWGFLVVYSASVVLFLVSSRYRLPVLPVLIAYAGFTLVWMFDAVLARRWKSASLVAGACCALFFATHAFPVPKEASQANGLWWLGIAEARAGRSEKAVDLFEQSIASRPDFCYVHTSLAITLQALGRAQQANAELECALVLCPEDVQTLDVLCDAYVASGRNAQARSLAERSIAAAPYLARAHYNLGRAHFAAHEFEAAAAAFRDALAREPGYFNAAYALGVTLRALHRDDEALTALETAVAASSAAKPEFVVGAYEELVTLLEARGEHEAARRHAQELLTRYPNDARAKRLRDRM